MRSRSDRRSDGENRIHRIGDAQPRGMALVADESTMVAEVPPVPAPHTIHVGSGTPRAPSARRCFRRCCCCPPVRGALRVRKLVEVVPPVSAGAAALRRIPPADRSPHGSRRRETDFLQLRSGGRRRQNRDEAQAQQLREIGFRNRRRPDDASIRQVFDDPAVAQGIQEQRAPEPVFQAAGG